MMLQQHRQQSEKSGNDEPSSSSSSSWRCRQREPTLLKIFIIQWIIMFTITVLSSLYIGDFIQALINSSLVVSPKSDIFSLWKHPPVNPEMKIYLFNASNAEAWINGSDKKLRVDEVGPFVYRETWTKTNITFHDENGTVSYYLSKTFEYLPETSVDDNVVLTVANIPLFSAIASMKNANSWSRMGFSAALNVMDAESKKLFLQRTAKELLWGYDDTLSSFASLVLPPEEVGLPGKFGLFAGKNNTFDGVYTVSTGAKSLKQLSQAVAYRDKKNFKAWTTPACNKIRGSEGSFFPPGIKKTDLLEIFVPDLCGTIPLAATGEEFIYQPGDVSALRFRPHPHTFRYDVPDNHCYCSGEAGLEDDNEDTTSPSESWLVWPSFDQRRKRRSGLECPERGVFNLGACKFGAPLAVSWPHFLNADERLLNNIDGLHLANESFHGLRMDIQPTMGLGLSAFIRLQMNLRIESSSMLDSLVSSKTGLQLPESTDGGPKNLLLPIMWFDDVIDSPPDNLLVLLGDALVAGDRTTRGVLIFSGLLLACQIIVVGAYIIWRRSVVGSKKHCQIVDDGKDEAI